MPLFLLCAKAKDLEKGGAGGGNITHATLAPHVFDQNAPLTMGGGGGAGYGTNNKGGAGGAGGGIILIRAGAFQNNNTYEQCTSPMSYTGLTDGEHTFEVFATDAATNKEKPQARRIWTVVTSTRSSEENSFLGGGVTSCSATGGDASLVLMGLGTFLTLARRRRRGSSST